MITKINLTVANAYIVSGERVVIVDTGAPGNAQKILKVVAKLGYTPSDVALILLTHGHNDHAGSAAALRDITKAPIAIHQADRAMIQRGDNGNMLPVSLEASISKPFVVKPFGSFDADIFIQPGDSLAPYGINPTILHTPGHSDGSLSFVFANGDAIVGDILRGGIMGGTFLSGQPHYPYFLYDMADKATIQTSVQRVLDTGAQQIFVGHGGALKRTAVQKWLEHPVV